MGLNTKLAKPVLEFLLKQFDKYYEQDEDILPPVKLSLCLASRGGEFMKGEPLDRLVYSIQLCTKQ